MKCPKCGFFVSHYNPQCHRCGYIMNTAQIELANRESRYDAYNHSISSSSSANETYRYHTLYEPFYQKTWFILLMTLLFWPLGIVLMWKYERPHFLIRLIITSLACIGLFSTYTPTTHNHYLDTLLQQVNTITQSSLASQVMSTPHSITPKISFDNISAKQSYGTTIIYGEVTNNDTFAHSFAFLIGFYDENNRLLTTANDFILDIKPGETKLFETMLIGGLPQNIKSYKGSIDYYLE